MQAASADDLVQWTARLGALAPSQWSRIAAAVSDQRGESMQALWRRGAHRSLWMASIAPHFRRGFQVAAVFGQLVKEFAAPDDLTRDVHHLRAYATRNGTALASAMAAVAEIANASLPGDAIGQEAVLIAAHAVATRAALTPELFAAAYAPVAAVLPLANGV